ncbi:MAG: MarR family transcriptional regulator [Pseudomonadota bacterium]
MPTTPSRTRPVPGSRRTAAPAAAPPVNFYNAKTYQPDESVAYLMRRIMTNVAAEVDAALEPAGLTNAQWVPLYKLHLGHPSTVAELARGCQLDTGAMTRTLDRLEAKGLLRRVRSEQDRRVVNIELTDEGRTAAGQIPPVLSKVLNDHLRGFSFDEWQTLKTLLTRMLGNAQQLQARREDKNAD